jgi:DNA-binding LacI/PurR family transcriptional regulator
MTVYELAEECGVSIATVSRVLNGHKAVHPDTRERVLLRMQELGYLPNQAARALSTGRTRVVSVWIGNLSSRYVMAFLGQLEQHLAQADYEMLLRNLWHRPLDDATTMVGADGVIVLDEVAWVERLHGVARPGGTPTVSMGKFWVSWVDHVGLDLTDAVRDSVRHLVEMDCRRVGYVSPKMRNVPQDTQYRTYRAAVEEAGREPEIIETPSIGDRRRAEEAMEQYLAAGNRPPDGLLCHNDDHAIAVSRALRRHGLRIPEDVAVVGCNGLVETEYLEHPLSTIVLPVAEACEAAWQLLEERMRNPELPVQSVVLKPQLVVRDSSNRTGQTAEGLARPAPLG